MKNILCLSFCCFILCCILSGPPVVYSFDCPDFGLSDIHWQELDASDRIMKIDYCRRLLNSCRDRLPEKTAYEYPVLFNRLEKIEKLLGFLSGHPDHLETAGKMLKELDALIGEITCRENEG